eukprot:m.234313 g.234313  ORF g.234313 m.234313 type:complete len:529 (-) comp19547_c0_seq1:33-1619(-)
MESAFPSTSYFGTARCTLQPVVGRVFPADKGLTRTESALGLLTAPVSINEHLYYLPALPQSRRLVGEALGEDEAASAFPVLIKHPQGKVEGIESGVRSAVVHHEGRFVRLKGCGNNHEGLKVRDMCDDAQEPVRVGGSVVEEIRGCMFEHTADNELLMTRFIAAALQPHGLVTANTPLFKIMYAQPLTGPFPPALDVSEGAAHGPDASTPVLPTLPYCCGVFETRGDFRLADHVLRGLELLLPSLVDLTALSAMDASAWFPEGAFGPRCYRGEVTEMDETHMQLLCGGGLEAQVVLADLSAVPLPLIEPATTPETNSPTCDKARTMLQTALMASPAGSTLLGLLYARLGRECGVAMRAIQAAGVCWGSFRDLGGMHCNAHGNNFALCHPTAPAAPLLAPLDFDFAFDLAPTLEAARKQVPAGDDASGSAVNKLPEQLQEWFDTEPAALAMDLACARTTTGTKNDHEVDARVAVLRWALRDTMVRTYLHALRGEQTLTEACEEEAFVQHRAAFDAVLQLALALVANVKA